MLYKNTFTQFVNQDIKFVIFCSYFNFFFYFSSVEIMKRKLDPENLGIILLNAFMEEFYQREESSTPDTFPLWHYNGLPRSNPDGKVKYNFGNAVLLECELKTMSSESNAMLTCLQTKWPSIEINWNTTKTPSLN